MPRPRCAPSSPDPVGSHRRARLSLTAATIETPSGTADVLIDDNESPLAWLARRKGRDGRRLIAPEQFVAGERLRADFTRANLMPRVTARWEGPTGGGGAGAMTENILAARQRVDRALAAVGPEFSGLLLDVCCFLRGLEDAERERGWPARSAKIVLQLGLDRLARHYGYRGEISGRAHPEMRAWRDG